MFTVAEREELRERLVAAARTDSRVVSAALVGSGARGGEDQWSDIDVALSLRPGTDPADVVGDWTTRLYRDCAAVDHLDVWSGGTRFRVFLLASTLQVDIAFWAEADFGATGPDFRLLFGTANQLPRPAPPAAAELVGWGWLYALHARASLARGRVLQAEYMVSGLRNQVLALACRRHGLPAVQGRGMDDLPASVRVPISAAFARSLDPAELRRAFTAACHALLHEARQTDADLTDRIDTAVRNLAHPPGPD